MKSVIPAVLALVALVVVAIGMYFLWIEPRETIFVATALGAVVGSVVAVTRRNPVYSIISLLVVFLCVALQFWVLAAELLAALQLIVYAGAILMVFLFVIMLFNLDSPDPAKELGEIDVTGRPSAEEAERAAQGLPLNTPRVRALFLSVAVGVLLIVPILLLEDPPDADMPHWNRFLPLTHEPLSDALEDRIRRAEPEETPDAEIAERLDTVLRERAEAVTRVLKHKGRDERDEAVLTALGRRVAEAMRIQGVEDVAALDLEASSILRLVRDIDAPALRVETQSAFADHLRPRLAAIGVESPVRREIYVELAVRGRLGPGFGSIPGVGTELIEQQVVSLEYVGLIILAGCIGAAMLARRRSEDEEEEATAPPEVSASS